MEPAAVASGYPPSAAASSVGCKLRLMCSYGGRIVPRPTDKALCYLGGETRMVVVDRRSPLAELSARISLDLLGGRSFSLKYKLPDVDLDSLISVSAEEDLEIMIEEIDRISTAGSGAGIRLPRLRLFLFLSENSPSVRSILKEHDLPRGSSSDNDSSSASTSSAPSLSDLPPIPVPTDERRSDQCIALSSSNSDSQIEDEGFDEPELADVVAIITSSSESSPTNVVRNSGIIPFSVAESPDPEQLQQQHPNPLVHPMQQPPQASQIPVCYLAVPQHMPYPLFSYQPANLMDPRLMASSGKPSLPISPAPIPSAFTPLLIQLVSYHWMQNPHHAAMANYAYEIPSAYGQQPQMNYSQAFSQPPF